MLGRTSLIRVVGFMCLLPGALEPLAGQMGSQQEVTALRFQGNREFPGEALANAIITRETDCRSFILLPLCLAGIDFALDSHFLNERELRRDHARVRLFYYLRGYREAVVDTLVARPSDDEVRITFQVEEGPPIEVVEVDFQGVEGLPDSYSLEGLPIQVGEPLSLIALDATIDTLESRMRNRGFAHADALRSYFIPSERPYEAQVTFDLYPGPLTRLGPVTVDITGADGTEPSMEEEVVRRMLPFEEGDVFREDLQVAGQRNLYNLEIFRFVTFVPDTLTPPDSILPLTIQLEEGSVHRVRTGGGLSTAECFNFEASWSSWNFLGGARRLQLRGRVSNVLASDLGNTILCSDAGEDEFGDRTGSISIDFTQPYFFSPRTSLSASLFAERQSVAPIFVREAVGFGLGVNRTLTPSTLLGFSYRPQLSSLTAAEVFFCSAYLVCDPDQIRFLQDENLLSPVAVSLSWDRRDQPLSPTRGYSAAFNLEHADSWTGSDFRYTSIISEGTWHARIRPRWVIGTRLYGGWVIPGGLKGLSQDGGSDEIVHPEKRLFSGGSNSVRGFAQNRLGPRVLYLENATKLYAENKGPCTPAEVADLSCDAGALDDEDFFPSPTGGTRLLEGSLELRFPLSGRLWEGATFLDFGQVWADEETPRLEDLELTPGIGIRYFSPIGPVRVDVGYRFAQGERLTVVTQKVKLPADGSGEPEVLEDLVVLNTPVLFGENVGPWDIRRFQLHLSIGQAF